MKYNYPPPPRFPARHGLNVPKANNMTALLCHTAHSTPPPIADLISCKQYIFSVLPMLTSLEWVENSLKITKGTK